MPPIEIADAFKQPQLKPTPPAAPPVPADTGQGLSFDQVFKKPPAGPSLANKVGKDVDRATRVVGRTLNLAGNTVAKELKKVEDLSGYTDWFDETNNALKGLATAIKGDIAPDEVEPSAVNAVKRWAHIAYHALGPLSTVAAAPLDAALIHPVQAALGKLGNQLEKYFPSGLSPEDRRLGVVRGEAPKLSLDEEKGWKMHKEDIASTIKGLQDGFQMIAYAMPLGEGAGALKSMVGLEKAGAGARLALDEFKQAAEPKPPALTPVAMSLDKELGFGKIHEFLNSPTTKASLAGGTRTVGALLDDLTPLATGYAKNFLEILRKHADPNVPVKFEQHINNYRGLYNSAYHNIRVSLSDQSITHTLVHEIVHSATVNMLDTLIEGDLNAEKARLGRALTPEEKLKIVYKPHSPVLKELDSVIAETKLRAQKSGRTFDRRAKLPYGVTGDVNMGKSMDPFLHNAYKRMSPRYEFLAEVFSNPDFQEFLANSSQYASAGYKVKNLLNQLGVLIGKHLGIRNQQELQLLHQSMRIGTRLIKMQDELKPPLHRQLHNVILGRLDDGETITKGDMDIALGLPKSSSELRRARGALRVSLEQMLRAVAPESLGKKAKLAAGVVASRVTEMMQSTSAWRHGSETRLKLWRARPDLNKEFTQGFEKGRVFKEPVLNDIAKHYREWNQRIVEQDAKITGLEYEARENYLYHVFEDSEDVASYFDKKYGSKWGDPKFIKDRTFDLYEEAIAAGFRPKYDNPEDIMLARQQASDVAKMQAAILSDLEKYGLATKQVKGENKLIPVVDTEGKMKLEQRKVEGNKQPANTTRWRAPNGKVYWVDNHAHVILDNAFRSKSLWSDRGIAGLAFRGMMGVKNLLVPIRLAVSLFHPLHVAGIDIAAGWSRSAASLLSGTKSPIEFAADLFKSGFGPVWQNPKMGWRVMKVWKGEVPKELLTDADTEALKTLIEGGLAPEMSSQYRTNARKRFMDALRDTQADFRLSRARIGEDAARAVWHAPWALISAMAEPIFEKWIPSLKAASYLQDAKALLERDPGLVLDDARRKVALRKLAKSAENRYGEMAYNNLFWKRWIKDLAVLNTLSLGWQMGFIREYGGGAMDLGQFAGSENKLAAVRRGDLDRPLFIAAYTTLGAGTAGLMTWALSGNPPSSLLDYIAPRTGEVDENGKPKRANTMFYSREFASLYKHIENQGAVSGLEHLIGSKSSGVFGQIAEWASGVDSFGQEYRDPNGTAFQKLEQTLAYTLANLEPISMKAMQENGGGKKGAVLDVLGFTPAPKYLTESKTQAEIISAYRKYVAPKERPFDRAEYSKEFSQLRKYYQEGDSRYADLLDKMSDQYDLSARDQRRLIRTLNSNLSSAERMFIQLPWMEQKKILDAATPEERDELLPHANKEHLRRSYSPPGDGQ